MAVLLVLDALGFGNDWRESILSLPSSEEEEDESETTLEEEEDGFLKSLSSLQSSGRVLVLTK